MNSKSLLLVGSLYARAVGTTGAFLPLMNGKMEVTQQLDTQEVPNFQRMGGGKDQIFSRIKGMQVDLELHRWDKRNWALALGAPESAIVTAGTVTAEEHEAFAGGMVRLNHVASSITSVVTDADVAMVEGVDYTLVPGGVLTAADGAIKISYNKAGYIEYQACTKLDTELECYYVGQNENDGGKLVTVDLYRLYVPPTDKIALMTDKLASAKLKCELLSDASKGVGESAFWKFRVQA